MLIQRQCSVSGLNSLAEVRWESLGTSHYCHLAPQWSSTFEIVVKKNQCMSAGETNLNL